MARRIPRFPLRRSSHWTCIRLATLPTWDCGKTSKSLQETCYQRDPRCLRGHRHQHRQKDVPGLMHGRIHATRHSEDDWYFLQKLVHLQIIPTIRHFVQNLERLNPIWFHQENLIQLMNHSKPQYRCCWCRRLCQYWWLILSLIHARIDQWKFDRSPGWQCCRWYEGQPNHLQQK